MSETFYLAATTKYGIQAATSLLAAGFECRGVITPVPRPVGRHHVLTPTSVDMWAMDNGWPKYLVQEKITRELEAWLRPVDWLLVLDFGYYVPRWLINFPKSLSVNIHPSKLPKWRGASPGQAVLLSGERESAVSIMTLAAEMDAGDLLTQIPFDVESTWTSQEYYDHAFTLASRELPATLRQYAAGALKLTPQEGKPTLAPKISKADAFVTWQELTQPDRAAQIERMIRAYSPWPHAWTLAPTSSGEKRLQLLTSHLEDGKLVLDDVKLEGETIKKYEYIAGKFDVE